MKCVIKLAYDKEADVWIATSDDVKGLALESGSLDALIQKVKTAVPELLELNSNIKNQKITIHFLLDVKQEVYA